MNEILKIQNLKKYFVKKSIFSSKTNIVRAVDDVSIDIKKGEVLVIAGESGSGKTTIAKLILNSIQPDSGKVFFEGREITKKNIDEIKLNCQMIYQDPYDSINPRMRIEDIVAEPLEIHKLGNKNARRKRVIEVLQEVRLEPVNEIMKKYPHMLSGGQRQRIAIARALTLKPKIILADESVSMLDVSIRAEILELLQEMQQKNNIAFIYITHDLATARHFGQRIAIMYLGKIVEIGPIDKVLSSPQHPYTQALIDAVFEINPENKDKEKRIRINDNVKPETSQGCNFAARCPYVMDKCVKEPELKKINEEHFSACYAELN